MSNVFQHRVDGRPDAPPLILGPSIGTSLRVWEQQIPDLTRHFQVVRFDLPGHSGSVTTALRSMSDLGRGVLDLADAYGWTTFHYAGISLSGAVGATLAIDHSDRLESLTMVCSSARFGDPQSWRDRAALVRDRGVGELVDVTAQRWFSGPPRPGDLRSRLLGDLRGVDPEAYAACCDVLAAYDVRDDLGSIDVPTLVVSGRSDPATPPSHGRELVDGIGKATLVEIPEAAHLAPVDQPRAVTTALLGHLRDASDGSDASDVSHGSASDMSDRARRDGGMSVRRAVLGDAHVDRAIGAITPFTADFQDFITRYAWGDIWSRPGLDRRARSIITLTALVGDGHHNELAMHVRGAVNNGLSPDEIQEVLLQTAIYCGVPTANSAFAIAARTLEELALERSITEPGRDPGTI